MEKPICKRCLLMDTENHPYLESVQKFRASLPPRQRCPEEQYQRRLAKCRECDHLLDATCGLCGCYVEMRAAQLEMHCPRTNPPW